MNTFNYQPSKHLHSLFNSPESLEELPQLLWHTHLYKSQLDRQIHEEINKYNNSIDLSKDIHEFIQLTRDTKIKSANAQSGIVSMTSSIQHLDKCKKNLVLSMTILKRLQMLIDAYNTLNSIIPSHDYQNILKLFSVVKDLLTFFKPYKSIDEINQLNIQIGKTQNKLVDDIFIDFEDSVVNNNFQNTDQLIYGCHILEMLDSKYKDRLLTWFYNVQLKEIKSIFNNFEEAGSLDDLNRRYIYFNNVLKQTQSRYLNIFPADWSIDMELSKIFCNFTKQDLSKLLNNSIDSKVLLDSLLNTLDFEKSLNEMFATSDFNQIISKVFEPYLSIWVNEQDKYLQSKFLEFLSMPKIPQEFSSTNNPDEFLTILKVNNVPNISNSSIDLIKVFQKILTQILKLSNGEVLIDLSNLFMRYFYEYNNKILSPILPSNDENLNGIESIKYLTMLLNTGDYIINNINDLQDKFRNLINQNFKSRVNFENVKESFYQLINRSISSLLAKISNDLRGSWRRFINNNWTNMESANDVSSYMIDYIKYLVNNIKIILPLIIRESYIKNFCNKLVELIINEFMNNLKLIRPLSILNIEQILLDLKVLKEEVLRFPLYSNPNFDSNKNKSADTSSNLYKKFVTNQFNKIETVLKLLLTPAIPIDNLIENYFQLIGDKSVKNFTKILNLKNVDKPQQNKCIENFKLQLTLDNDLIEESSILSYIEDDEANEKLQFSKKPSSPEVKSPKLLSSNLKINNFEKNLREFALNGENHVNKLNENFKNFGKFFRKDSSNE